MKKTFYILMILFFALSTMECNAQKKRAANKPNKTEVKKDTLTVIRERVEKGDDVAMNILGSWYYSGQYVQKDYREAVKWFSKSAEKNNMFGIGNFAMCFQTGNGITKDSVMAVKLYKKAFTLGNSDLVKQHEGLAKKGNLFSAMLLADCYTHGDGVKRDAAKALEMLKLASDAGSTDGQVKYGLACMNTKNYQAAAPVFEKLAAKNNPTGIYYTGYLLFKGMGVTQDKPKGLQYLAKAANLNMPNANYYLGKAYYEGDGVAKDVKKAVDLLQKSTSSPLLHDSWYILGNAYLGGEGVDKDFNRALNCLSQLSDNKDYDNKIKGLLDESGNSLFKTYIEGLKDYYINKDFANAMKNFKLLTKAGNIEGTTMQALSLLNGDNKKGNVKKGLKLLTEASSKSGLAAYTLGKMYENGENVDKDSKKGVDLISKAADMGLGEAVCAMGMKYFKGEGVTQDLVKAAQLFLQAESMQSLTPDAARMLVECYQKKISSIPDLDNTQERILKLGKVSNKNNLLDLLKKL
ncbi:MAG: sel1 repeat family protein [Bacteroidaceae bacterium]|nr:sel1 repeat family protein [Bacteroidaceae bacterium]